ncbi:hypothetical protein MMC17_000193, partial [Xylographa soralifera]|nr:hypothetical protein [Xylographa soralifera]
NVIFAPIFVRIQFLTSTAESESSPYAAKLFAGFIGSFMRSVRVNFLFTTSSAAAMSAAVLTPDRYRRKKVCTSLKASLPLCGIYVAASKEARKACVAKELRVLE